MKSLLLVITTSLMLSGCGSLKNMMADKTKIVEYYRIFDLKTSVDRQTLAEAASNGLGRNVNNAEEMLPIPNFSVAPEKPGRFKLVTPELNPQLAAFVAMSGQNINTKQANCDDAVWTAKAVRDVRGSDNLRLTACLFQYQEGYHLDFYAIFTKKEGGLMQVSRSLAQAAVGTPEEWTEKTFLDIVRNIRAETGAEVTYLEGAPKIQGMPWLDNIDI